MDFAFSSARAAVVATDLMLDVIHRYKYRGALWFEPLLCGLLCAEAIPALRHEHWDFIVPVPLHALKQREREFNQAERLGAALAAASGLPLRADVIARVTPTQTQTRLSRQERAANVKGAFAPTGHMLRPQCAVILVDDVFTTGATTNAAARALKNAGAAKVCVWTVARGL